MTTSTLEPRLVAVAGLLANQVFPLVEPELTMGRDAANSICVPDPALSRRHCSLVKGDSGWTVRDLESSNGTFVNGIQVSARPLTDGDRIAIGASVFLFVHAPSAADASAEVVEVDVHAATTRLAIDDIAYLKQPAAAASSSRVEQGLRALLAMSAVINGVRTEDELHLEALRLVRDVVPAEQAAIVLQQPPGDLRVVHPGTPARPFAFSAGIVRRVL